MQLPIPWKSLLLSKPVIINLVTQLGAIWCLFTLTTQAPTYFNFVLGLNIKQVKLASTYTNIMVKESRFISIIGILRTQDRILVVDVLNLKNAINQYQLNNAQKCFSVMCIECFNPLVLTGKK